MRSVEALVELFRQRGFKITPQRRAVFELLSEDKSHLTVEEIYRGVCAMMPDISRTTVYNTLHELVEIGELAPVEETSGDGVRYDTHTGSHHHLFCLRCHALVDVERDFEGLELAPDESAGYQVVKCKVIFYGYCPNCKDNTS
jgi:Fe2+ or Zn2+ uptake regulation protein